MAQPVNHLRVPVVPWRDAWFTPSVVERWHLDLAAWSLLAGAFVVLGDLRGPRWMRSRSVAIAGLAGAALGSVNPTRALPWVLAAAVLVVPADLEEPAHPLGPVTVLAAVVSLIGVWSAVPDTEPPLAAGCVVAVVGLERAWQRRTVGISATAALVVAVFGSAWVGSAGWTAAMASAAAVGMVLCAPVGIGLRRPTPGAVAVLAAVHVAGAVVVPRLLMVLRPGPALLGGAVLLAVELVISVIVARLCVPGGPRWRAPVG